MSCPIPIRIINPHYRKIASLSAIDVSQYEDREDYYLDVPCGVCYHCRKKYKSQWNIRLQHHYRYLSKEQQTNSYFVTLTFDDDHLPNPRPTKAEVSPLVRKFLERVRKRYKRSFTHWIVSELGSTTKRYHLHGIFFDIPFPIWQLTDLWKYGFTSYRQLNPRRISYCTSYANKQIKGLLELPSERQHVFCSPGIGKAFTDDSVNILFSHKDSTIVPFTYFNNRPVALPRYYRTKMFTPDELEDVKESYFHFLSEDVIPDPPYYLGTTRFDDYTLYLEACKELRIKKNRLYYKSNKSFYEQQLEPLV